MNFKQDEIILNEAYGSSVRRVLYMKKADKNGISVQKENGNYSIGDCLTKIFLPHGYPDSVSKDYISYQIWDTAQAFCSTITGTLAMQGVLRGVGVGSAEASPLAATITWVIKDGCGHIGRIFFAYSHGTQLDAHSKMWRLYADILNDAAMCLEIALPCFENSTTFVLCISTAMKAIVGVAGGATRAALTQHHAVRANMADVAAKDSAQETAVNLVASFTALAIVALFGCSYFIFVLTIILHITCNYFAVQSVCLKTLNENRFLEVIKYYFNKEEIPGPKIINQKEPIFLNPFNPNTDLLFCGLNIKMGSSIESVAMMYPGAVDLKSLTETYKSENYILYPCVMRKTMYVLLKDNACVDDVLCAYFHAVLLSILICAINKDTLPMYPIEASSPLGVIYDCVQSGEWSRDTVSLLTYSCGLLVYAPSADLTNYCLGIAKDQWPFLCKSLRQSGWNLDKHLVVVDEWRVAGPPHREGAVQTLSTDSEHRPKLRVPSFATFSQEKLSADSLETFTIEPEPNLPPLDSSNLCLENKKDI